MIGLVRIGVKRARHLSMGVEDDSRNGSDGELRWGDPHSNIRKETRHAERENEREESKERRRISKSKRREEGGDV